MRPLRSVQSAELVAIATDAEALGLPPADYAIVPDSWNPTDDRWGGCVPEIELEIWAPAALALTDAILYGARAHPLAFADVTVTPTVVKATITMADHTTHLDSVYRAKVPGFGGNAFTLELVSGMVPDIGEMTNVGSAYTFTFKDNTTSQLNLNSAITASADLEVVTAGTTATKLRTTGDVMAATPLAGGSATMHATAHGLLTGDGPVHQTAGTSFPTDLDGVTPYWIIKDTADIFWLAASLVDALAGNKVDFASAGVGAQKTVETATTQRLSWETHDGLLGIADDGAISLDAQIGYSKRVPHSPRVVAYALVGSIDTGTLSASILPIQDRE